ncbi:MAG: DUF1592 domain-containing protein [Gemmataceae bacterium]
MRTVLFLLAVSTPALAADEAGYTKVVAPFFATYCNKCHVGEKPRGSFSLEQKKLSSDLLDPATRGRWKEVVNVLHSHEMPPKKSPQPSAREVTAVTDWITQQAVQAELTRRETAVVLRRLNRDEYRNTIRDLVGVDVDVSGFPQDPPAGGFDNIGSALTTSPLHLEIYLNAARQILDRALVEGAQPRSIRWRFEPRVGPGDQRRVRLDERNNPIVNGSNNKQDGRWVMIHHNSWDKTINARDFRVPVAGKYLIRLSTAHRIPDRAEVVRSAEKILAHRRDEQDRQRPAGAKWHREQFDRDLEHFRTDRMYDYGPPRVKLVLQLGSQPRTVAEFDALGTKERPQLHESTARFTTESAGVTFEYAYSIPAVLENFWLQRNDVFARPELLIDWFEIEGPVFDTWPPRSHTGILFDSPLRATDEPRYVAEVLRRFMQRAFRRPITEEEITPRLRQFERARTEGASLIEALKRSLVSVLTSPHFLFLVEPAREGKGPFSLSDHELAARLSYLTWSSMPDAELRRLADAGKLRDRVTRLKQLDRLLADEKSAALTRNFAGQWLNLRLVGTNSPATDLYPQYDRHLETSIVGESEAFFHEILHRDLDLRNFIRSDFVVINERLARFYGIPGVRGDAFRKVPVPPGVKRGGIVTQASILTTTSNGTRTSPVRRGTWILRTLLGIDPGLPVANAGEIAPKVPGIDKATVRKRLEIHRQLDQCARCHNKIDPLGFALENYNAAGEWRDQEGFGYKGRVEKNDPKIDASSEMIDGTRIVGVEGLQEAMLQREDLFLASLASKLLTYAIGRELGLADQPSVRTIVASTKKHGRTLRAMLQAVITAEAFETK